MPKKATKKKDKKSVVQKEKLDALYVKLEDVVREEESVKEEKRDKAKEYNEKLIALRTDKDDILKALDEIENPPPQSNMLDGISKDD